MNFEVLAAILAAAHAVLCSFFCAIGEVIDMYFAAETAVLANRHCTLLGLEAT